MSNRHKTPTERQAQAIRNRVAPSMPTVQPTLSKQAIRRLACTDPARPKEGKRARFHIGEFLDRSRYYGNGERK